MYFSDEIILITTDDSGTDEIGRQTETETGRVTVYGDICRLHMNCVSKRP